MSRLISVFSEGGPAWVPCRVAPAAEPGTCALLTPLRFWAGGQVQPRNSSKINAKSGFNRFFACLFIFNGRA